MRLKCWEPPRQRMCHACKQSCNESDVPPALASTHLHHNFPGGPRDEAAAIESDVAVLKPLLANAVAGHNRQLQQQGVQASVLGCE